MPRAKKATTPTWTEAQKQSWREQMEARESTPGTPALILTVPLAQLRPSACNPRTRYEPERLKELSASILAHGVLEPLLARPLVEDGAFEASRPSVTVWEGTPCRTLLLERVVDAEG